MIDRLARQTSFLAPAAVMSAWAVVMLHTVASGHINRLLSPMFRNYVLVAGVFLLVLSALYLFLYQPASENAAPAFAPTGRLRQFGRWAMLLIPLIAASVLSPSAFSSTTLINRTASASTVGGAPMPTFPATVNTQSLPDDPNQPAPLEVTDLITLGRAPAQMKAFDGRKVIVVGRILNAPGTGPKLIRMVMWCCAADAMPVSVDLTGNTAGDWKDGQWIEVIGTAQFPATLGRVIPRIEVESIKPAQEPDEPYLSP